MSPKHAIPDRLRDLTSWYSDWRGLRVAVLGLGVTGFSVADTLAELGVETVVFTDSESSEREQILAVLGVEVVVDDLQAPHAALLDLDPDLVIASPGFPPHHPLIRWAGEHHIPVWGDIELAWRVRDKTGTPAEWVTVTGTNGKTTTVGLTAAMFAAAGVKVAPCGNIGVPVLDAVRDPEGFDVFVVELSSHQLHYLQASDAPVSPYASTCLNIAQDHLLWHGGFDEYRAAKARVYENTAVACVYNKSDEQTRQMVEAADVIEGARAIGFDLGVPGPSDLGVVDGILCDRAFLDERRHTAIELITRDELSQLGFLASHSVENVLAAAALARSYGVDPEAIVRALRSFSPEPHRIEHVATFAEVTWVDDSKATNPHAANASLSAFDRVVWLVGGQLKGVDLSDLIKQHASRLQGVVVIGTEQEAILSALQRHAPDVPVVAIDRAQTEGTMSRAVKAADEIATAGDTVLLAPAAASFDQFASYSERGRLFAEAVHVLCGGEADGTAGEPRQPEE